MHQKCIIGLGGSRYSFSVFLAKHFVFSIDGMTKVIHRLESHAETDQPIEEVKNSLECD